MTKKARSPKTAITEHRFRPKPTRKVPRFAGVSTFLRLPEHDEPKDVDVLICGAPFDGGTTYRPGARFGPRAVRNASALTRGFHPGHDLELFENLRCADGGDVVCVPMSVERSIDAIAERASEIAAANAIPIFIGGDHTISLAPLRALAKKFGPLGLIHLDAHSDTFGPAWGIDLHHGTVFRKAVEEKLLRPKDVMQIGIRGPFTAANDLEFAQKAGFRIVMVDEVKENLAKVKKEIASWKKRGAFYVSLDMDALDPAFAPGTGTPVPGGLDSYEMLSIIRSLAGFNIVGADIVEISPDHDTTGNTALLAATMLTEVVACIAATKKQKAR